MLEELIIIVAVVAAIGGVFYVDHSEKQRALRHIAGREPLTPAEFGKQFFQGCETTIAEKLIHVLSRHLDIDLSRLHPDDRLVDDLRMDALDSLATVEFILDIEEEFELKVPDDVAEKMCTLREAVTFLSNPSLRT